MKLFIWPDFNPTEKGEGGIRRVWEAQQRYLPDLGIELVKDMDQADLVAVHADELKTDKPTVTHNHGLYWAGYVWPDWAINANAKIIRMMKRSKAVSTPTKWVRHSLARGMLLDATVLYHGVNIEEWEPTDTYGYVYWGKNRPDAICDPDPINKLAAYCPELGFMSTFGHRDLPNLVVTGKIDYEKSKEFIKHAGLYLATVLETGAISLLEAAASAVPSVGWDYGANSELIIHKETGWLAEPGDYVGLREGLYYCLEHRDRLGSAARQHVIENFQWKDRIADYIPFYEKALEGVPHTGPKVSIIVTAYNLQQYLPRCLDSILEQDFQDWECIVVDDASPDLCGAIADEYAAKDSRFKVIHNRTNQYLAESRNIGIRVAQGEYILPLDADDEIGWKSLGILAASLDKDQGIDIAGGRFELVEPDGRRWLSEWPPKHPSYNEQIKQRNQLMYSSMYRKWVWERTGGYRRRWRSAEDAEFWVRAMSFGANPAHVADIPSLVYNNRPSSMSHTEAVPPWTSWMIWAKFPEFTPFGASGTPTAGMPARPVLMYGPALVTVVIPCGPEHEIYLQDAIDSVVNQTMQNWDLIVVNDTGKRWFADDGTPLTQWTSGYPFVNWIDGDRCEGVAAARNKGFETAQTEAVVLLDADDYFQPLALDMLYRAWSEYKGWVYTDFIDQQGNLKEMEDWDFKRALQKMPGPVTGIYSRSDWEKVGGFDPTLPGWEDWDFLLSLMENEICGTHLRYPAFTYRYDSGSRREKSYDNRKELLAIIRKKHEKLYKECGV